MKKLVILLIVSLCWAGVASAWDYNAEYTLDSNPAGVWSYGNVELATGAFFPFQDPVPSAPSGVRWENSTYHAATGPDSEGCASYNNTGVRQDWNSWAPGQSWLIDQTALMSPIGPHFGGPDYGLIGTAGRFTAPAAGLYDGEIIFENRVMGLADGSAVGLPTEVWVNVNGSNVHADVVSGFEDDPAANYSTYNFAGLSLAAGDTVDFFVSSDYDETEPWTGGDHLVGIEAVIVPEPITLSLLGLGGLALIRRRRA